MLLNLFLHPKRKLGYLFTYLIQPIQKSYMAMSKRHFMICPRYLIHDIKVKKTAKVVQKEACGHKPYSKPIEIQIQNS